MLFSTNYTPYGLKKTCSEAYAEAYFMINTVICCFPPFSNLQESIVILHLPIAQLAKTIRSSGILKNSFSNFSIKSGNKRDLIHTFSRARIVSNVLPMENLVTQEELCNIYGPGSLSIYGEYYGQVFIKLFCSSSYIIQKCEKNHIILNQHSPTNRNTGASMTGKVRALLLVQQLLQSASVLGCLCQKEV